MDHLAAAAAQEEREHDACRGEGEHRDREHAEDEHRPRDVVVAPDVAIEEGPRSAIWKKNGRLSVGGEMSAARLETARSGPPGAVSRASIGSSETSAVSTGVKSNCAARAAIVAMSDELNGCSLTSIVARSTPKPVGAR